MDISLNEIKATALKATRGAGYPWGLAEEAGAATQQLCAWGLDGCGQLLKILNQEFSAILENHTPKVLGSVWEGQRALCPITTGSALVDHRSILERDGMHLKNVKAPQMILPFAATIARVLGQNVSVLQGDVRATTDGTHLDIQGSFEDISSHIVIQLRGTLISPKTNQTRAFPSRCIYQNLEEFAHKTYAPATEESRRLGAGE